MHYSDQYFVCCLFFPHTGCKSLIVFLEHMYDPVFLFPASAAHLNMVQRREWRSETGRIMFVDICLQNNFAPANIVQQIFLRAFVAIVCILIQSEGRRSPA